MLQQLLDAEKSGALRLSRQEILQTDLLEQLTKTQNFVNHWLLVSLLLLLSALLPLAYLFFQDSYHLIWVMFPWLFVCYLISWRIGSYFNRLRNKYEFDVLHSTYPTYMNEIECADQAKSMSMRINQTIDQIVGDNLLEYLGRPNNVERLVIADVLLRTIDEKCRRRTHRLTEKHPVLNTFGLPFFYLCLAAFIAMLLDVDNETVKALTLFFIIAGLGLSISWSFGYDSWRNKKKQQEVESYENLRKALNAIIES